MNTVHVEPDGVSVTYADCPDLLCVQQGKITTSAIPIVCVPHHLTVQIEGRHEGDEASGRSGHVHRHRADDLRCRGADPRPLCRSRAWLGLANIVTLIAMALLGRRQAGEILLVRIVLGSVFTGGVSAMLFSIAGGVAAYLIMCLTIHRFPERLLCRERAGSLRAQCRAAAGRRRSNHGHAVHSGVCARARCGERHHRGVHRRQPCSLSACCAKPDIFRRHEPVLSFFCNILMACILKYSIC